MAISACSSSLELVIRLTAATLAGGVIGLNRRFHQKAAGTRTLALVSLGCALPAALAVDVASAMQKLDPNSLTRAMQGILTGIGFLGAGVILRRDDPKGVHGLTTAASVWVTAGIGIAFGAGYWVGAICTLVLLLAVLLFGGPIQSALNPTDPDNPTEPLAKP